MNGNGKLIESFPCRQDYAELSTEMLAKHARNGEPLQQYYYSKITLLNRCGITGRKAVDCLLNGVEDRAVRVGAQAARFRDPEEVLKYFQTVKPGISKETDRTVREKRGDTQMGANNIKTKSDYQEAKTLKSTANFKCHNCNEDGHRSFHCTKPQTKCNYCSKIGHLELYCRSKSNIPQNNTNKDPTVEKTVA